MTCVEMFLNQSVKSTTPINIIINNDKLKVKREDIYIKFYFRLIGVIFISEIFSFGTSKFAGADTSDTGS